MTRARSIVLTAMLLPIVGSIGNARDKAVYQTGKLIDVRSYATGTGALRAQNSFCLAIQVEDISYILAYEVAMPGDYDPTSLIIGDAIQVKIKGDKMYVKTGKKWTNDFSGKQHDEEAKMQIRRRERIEHDKKPTTCGIPVSVEH